MTLEQLVPSLDLCKELKENRYPQDTVFAWIDIVGKFGLVEVSSRDFRNWHEVKDWYAAPTASEIGEQLPAGVTTHKDPATGEWDAHTLKTKTYTHGKTEANARAKMWIYLKKNGYIKPEEVNTK